MTAKVINLCDYRKSKNDERRLKSVKGLDFPDDFSPFIGMYNDILDAIENTDELEE